MDGIKKARLITTAQALAKALDKVVKRIVTKANAIKTTTR